MPVLEYNPLTGRVTRKPDTNADRIRAMSDEELLDVLGYGCPMGNKKCRAKLCKDCWLDWLKDEVENNG